MLTLKFKPTKAGTAPLHLKYWRHWEGDKSIGDRFAVTIGCSPNPHLADGPPTCLRRAAKNS